MCKVLMCAQNVDYKFFFPKHLDKNEQLRDLIQMEDIKLQLRLVEMAFHVITYNATSWAVKHCSFTK